MLLAIWITENTIKNIAIGNLNLLTLHSQDLLSYLPTTCHTILMVFH